MCGALHVLPFDGISTVSSQSSRHRCASAYLPVHTTPPDLLLSRVRGEGEIRAVDMDDNAGWSALAYALSQGCARAGSMSAGQLRVPGG